MGWVKPFSDVEIAFIESQWRSLGTAETASRLGRSKRGVENIVNRLGLRAPCASAPASAPAPARADRGVIENEGQEADELEELIALKHVLKTTIRSCADPRAIPKLSAELRATVARIEELESGEERSGGLDGELLGLVQLRPA